jgi:hypothetical protein
MKSIFIFLVALALASVTNKTASAQNWTTSGNLIIGSEWLGAQGSSLVDLRIEHRNSGNIHLFTGTSFFQTNRMTIRGNNNIGVVGSDNTGYVGIGGRYR